MPASESRMFWQKSQSNCGRYMKLLFWNRGGKDNADLALACMRRHGVGVAAFAESSGTEFCNESLRRAGYKVMGFGGCDKIKLLASGSIYDIECFEESRFTVLVMKSLGARFIVAATHLVDRMSASDSELRLIDIRQMMGVVHGYEKVFSIDKTVIMGDLTQIPTTRSSSAQCL